MSVERDEVERIGRLAKLRLTDDETDRLTEEMNRILEHAERLRGLGETPEAGSAPGAEGEDADDTMDGDDGSGPRSSTRSAGAEKPDPLRIGLSAFAPDHREGFFVVPPPPGVMADDGDQASSRDPEGPNA